MPLPVPAEIRGITAQTPQRAVRYERRDLGIAV